MIAALTADQWIAGLLFALAASPVLAGLFRSTYSTQLTRDQRAVENQARAFAAMARLSEPKENAR